MTPLERLGLEVSAYTLLNGRGKAALLCALLDANGRTLTYEQLQSARAWRMSPFENGGSNGLKTRLCWLREAMEDVGLGGDVIINHPGVGYSLPEPGRKLVMDRLIEEVG